jgi:hypothetical protein
MVDADYYMKRLVDGSVALGIEGSGGGLGAVVTRGQGFECVEAGDAERVDNGLAAAGCDLDVPGLDLDATVLVIRDKGLDISGVALGIAIRQHLVVVASDGVHELVRSGDIRLAYVEMVDLDALGLGLVGKRHQFPYG